MGGGAVGFHLGGMLSPRLALLGELQYLGFSGAPEPTGNTSFVGAAHFWPVRWFFLGAGAGISDTGSVSTSDTGPAITGYAGIDFRGDKRFGFDLRGRYERRVDDGQGGRESVIVSLGFTWY